ncbi:Acg family FMN-binding oxidoreductase [Mycolicibacterium stellerae]|uniref:Acg family FMN-binding oxidoreductase n=1 Tax=Mycolicibacterium stellerae TaxID=2358193 RepID=UPI000F0B27D0|nr:NAD(P)H nitroreductase [Mycolicibacterium stellerae]
MRTPVTPHETIGADELAGIVELACRAPSLHNSQPWKWSVENGNLLLTADHSRVAHHTDVTGQEVLLSCGAVLDHLQVAAAAAGWRTSVTRYPDTHDRDRLASIGFQKAESVDEHDRALGDAITRRRTDRLAFAAPEPWDALEKLLREVLEGTVADLDVIDENGRPALAAASRRSEDHRGGDASYRYELLWWAGHSHVDDGLPQTALPSSTEARRVDVARDFPVYGTGDRRANIDRDHSKVLVLSTYDDSRENTVRCGEALSRVLLECTAAGFATCTLTHMIEVHDSREMVRRITGRHSEPQVLVRVGRAPETSDPTDLTPRRPIRESLQGL